MKKRVGIMFAVLLGCLFGVTAQSAQGLKSAKVEYVMTSGNNVPVRITQYSSDYNNLMCMEMSVDGMNIKTITRNDTIYVMNIELKSGFKYVKPTSDINYNQLTPELISKYDIQAVGTENFLDRNCTVYTSRYEDNGSTETARTWIYKGVMLKTISNYENEKSITLTAVSLDENPSLPDSLFMVPSDYNIVLMQ